MSRVRRVTANLPEDVLRDAMAVTGEGITETEHWVKVGELRRHVRDRGVSVS